MLEFGQLELVKKTFTREDSAPRGQAYNGVKFRRYNSESKSNPGLKETFTISNEAFKLLNLDEYALAQANIGGKVLLLVVVDQDEVEPKARFMRQSVKKDGTKLAKGHTFSNDYVKEGLIEGKVLDAESTKNQYLALTPIEVAGAPDVVKAAYELTIDTTVDASADTEGEEETTEVDGESRDFK